ncbi:MAG: hypothetical protein AAF587_18620 [Bacteroidota bacterium]
MMYLEHMRWCILCISILFSISCEQTEQRSCATLLYTQDQQLYKSFELIHQKRYELGMAQYIVELKRLQLEERSLYEQAKGCEFEDMQAFHYWHSGRMKFPSRIEMELNQYE